MANKKISELTLATYPLDETDLVAIVDASEGVTKRITVGELVTTNHPSTPQWDDLRFPALALNPGPANAPNEVNLSGLGGVYLYAFDDGITEDVHFIAQMPHSWYEGSSIEPHVHWTDHEGNTGDVVWALEYTKAKPGDVFGTTTTISSADTAGSQYEHQIVELGSIDMTGDTLSTILICRLYRDTDSGSDTMVGDAGLLEVDFHYQIDGFGSDQEFLKT